MNCDAASLVADAKCLVSIPGNLQRAVAIYILCQLAAHFDLEHPPPPCAVTIHLHFPGPVVVLNWTNPVIYDSIEVWHFPLSGSPHIETTLAGTATTFTTPPVLPFDFFSMRGIIADDQSPFGITGPCQ